MSVMKNSVLCALFLMTSLCCIGCQDVSTNSILGDDVIVINRVADELLKYVRIVIVDEGVDRINIPNLNVVFEGPFGIQGIFNATNGSSAYLSTVYRTGDAKVSYWRNKANLTLELGLLQSVVDYNNYKVKFLSIGPTGKMRATVGQNSLHLEITLHYNFLTCSEEVANVEMDKFGNISVQLTGLDPFNWLLDDIGAWIVSDFQNNIRYIIQDAIRNAVKSALSKYSICNVLPHLPIR